MRNPQYLKLFIFIILIIFNQNLSANKKEKIFIPKMMGINFNLIGSNGTGIGLFYNLNQKIQLRTSYGIDISEPKIDKSELNIPHDFEFETNVKIRIINLGFKYFIFNKFFLEAGFNYLINYHSYNLKIDNFNYSANPKGENYFLGLPFLAGVEFGKNKLLGIYINTGFVWLPYRYYDKMKLTDKYTSIMFTQDKLDVTFNIGVSLNWGKKRKYDSGSI